MVDVVIVGAGPTGLVAAIELKRRGFSCRIIDKAEKRSDKSRALVVQTRSMEFFQKMGIAKRFLEKGFINLNVSLFVKSKKIADLDFNRSSDDSTPFPYVLFISQAETESILENFLKELGTSVEYHTELATFEEKEDKIFSSVNLKGQQEIIESKYILGCDGAHSVVRHTLGLEFKGGPYPQTFLLADVKVEGEVPLDRLALYLGDKGIMALFPLEKDCTRILLAATDETQNEDPTLEEIKELAEKYCEKVLFLSQPKWLARFRLHHRGVNHYRVGRAFVAGDAAHIHSPAGGQGMNTGIQDAYNLAWKMALALEGKAQEKILDSYHEERFPVGQLLLKRTDRFFQFAATQSSLLSALRNLIVPFAFNFIGLFPKLTSGLFKFVNETAIRYRYSSLGTQGFEDNKMKECLGVGWRMPDFPLWNNEKKEKTTLFEESQGTSFQLLLCARNWNEAFENKIKLFRESLGNSKFEIRFLVITNSEFYFKDSEYKAFERLGVSEEAVYFIRPDGHILYRSSQIGRPEEVLQTPMNFV